MDSSNAEKAWYEYAPTLPGMLRPAEVNALRPHFTAGRASRDAEVAELTRLLAESRAANGDSEARRAELESVIAEALNAMTHGWAARKALDVVHSILHSKPSVVLEDRDRENRAIGWDEGAIADTKSWLFRKTIVDNPYRGDNR